MTGGLARDDREVVLRQGEAAYIVLDDFIEQVGAYVSSSKISPEGG
jgi:hypothetical protein